jgi:hypothetical protein
MKIILLTFVALTFSVSSLGFYSSLSPSLNSGSAYTSGYLKPYNVYSNSSDYSNQYPRDIYTPAYQTYTPSSISDGLRLRSGSAYENGSLKRYNTFSNDW